MGISKFAAMRKHVATVVAARFCDIAELLAACSVRHGRQQNSCYVQSMAFTDTAANKFLNSRCCLLKLMALFLSKFHFEIAFRDNDQRAVLGQFYWSVICGC